MDFQKIETELLLTMPLPDWGDDAHKGTRGKLLIIGGSQRIAGAVILAARAALRVGCGSVRVAAPASVALHIGIAVPELMVIPLPETGDGTIASSARETLLEEMKACQAVVLGPGLDSHDKTDALVRELVEEASLPMVVDAQALVALGHKLKMGEAPRIVTPHEAEFEALSGTAVGEDRVQTAVEFAAKAGVTIVLKGRETVIATEGETPAQNEAGTRALGTAGSGDVLAGCIGGFLAQGLSAHQAAVWGVHLHALAGEAAAKDNGEDGLMARDFIERLPGIQKYLRRSTQQEKRLGFGLRR
jgi:hydroxyethylthiazole kinase-like uncharacterized protein yjeF